MHLKVLLPYRVLIDMDGVTRIVAQTTAGSMGLLPRRLDCVAALTPGILIWETASAGERCAAVDSGIMVKAGGDVLITVRDAVCGVELARLQEAVETQFRHLDADELAARQALEKLSVGLVRRLSEMRHA